MITDPYSTHLPVLRAIGSALRVERVLELGAGDYSTREFLNRSSFPHLTRLVSDEPDREWRERIAEIAPQDVRHIVTHLMFERIMTSLYAYDLILIDCGTQASERIPYIKAIAVARTRAVVVIHDFEVEAYQKAAVGFEQCAVYSALRPWTAVCWNGVQRDLERTIYELQTTQPA